MDNVEIYTDAETTDIFKSLGNVDLNYTKQIPIFIKNIGNTRLINLSVESTYPDTTIIGKTFPVLEPGEVVKYIIEWVPGNKTMEIHKSGKKRTGNLILNAKEVI